MPIYAIHTDGPHYAPNKKQVVEILTQINDGPMNRFLCRTLAPDSQELTCFRQQLELIWHPISNGNGK